MLIHRQSLALGAMIASASILISFLGFSVINDGSELVLIASPGTQD